MEHEYHNGIDLPILAKLVYFCEDVLQITYEWMLSMHESGRYEQSVNKP